MTNESVLSEQYITEEMKKLVIARFETLNPDSKILLLGEKEPISVRDLINEVKQDTLFGKQIVMVQSSYLKTLAFGKI